MHSQPNRKKNPTFILEATPNVYGSLLEAHASTSIPAVTMPKPFPCPACTKSYVREAHLNTHLQKFHPFYYLQYEAQAQVAADDIDVTITPGDGPTYSYKGDFMDPDKLNNINKRAVSATDFGAFEEPDFLVDMQEFTNPSRPTFASVKRPAQRTTSIPKVVVDDRVPKPEDLPEVPMDPLYRTFDPKVPNDPETNAFNPWFPFNSAEDFKLARHFNKHNATKAQVTDYFNSGLGQRKSNCTSGTCTNLWRPSFQTADTMRKLIDMMEPQLSDESWNVGTARFYGDEKNEMREFYFRDFDLIITHLLQQPAFREVLRYAAVKEYNDAGERVVGEFETADWWWDEQVWGIITHP